MECLCYGLKWVSVKLMEDEAVPDIGSGTVRKRPGAWYLRCLRSSYDQYEQHMRFCDCKRNQLPALTKQILPKYFFPLCMHSYNIKDWIVTQAEERERESSQWSLLSVPCYRCSAGRPTSVWMCILSRYSANEVTAEKGLFGEGKFVSGGWSRRGWDRPRRRKAGILRETHIALPDDQMYAAWDVVWDNNITRIAL